MQIYSSNVKIANSKYHARVNSLLIEALVGNCCHLQHLVKLFRGEVIIEEVNGVNLPAVFMYFIVAMRPGRLSRATNITDNLPSFNPASCPGFYFG